MTSLVLFLSAALAAEPSANVSRSATAAEPAFHEIQRQVSDLLKREAQVKDAASRSTVIHAMCALHSEIVHDARYATSDVLKEYRARLWSRLTKIKAELKQQLARGAKANKDALEDVATLESAAPAAIVAADSLGVTLSLLDQSQGGPGTLLSFGGGPLPADFGPDLVALIERTINPNFWDVVGGPGTVYYYAPLQCLVVRATEEVHRNLGGLVGDVRAAGR